MEEELKKEVKEYQDQLSNVNSELETQKAKNDVSLAKKLATYVSCHLNGFLYTLKSCPLFQIPAFSFAN